MLTEPVLNFLTYLPFRYTCLKYLQFLYQYYYDISVYPFTEKDVMLCVDLEDETHQSAYRLQQLQNFLLNRGISDTWETMQYDYNADGTINVLDLMLLKKILNQSL